MRSVPRHFQPFLTWLTGKPLSDESPWRLKPMHHLVACIVPIAVGTAVGVPALALPLYLWWLLPVSWLLTTHGARKARTMVLHQCSHGNFLRRKTIDNLIGNVISIVLISQEYAGYTREHVVDHHSNAHMSMRDPTVQFLVLALRLRPGMSRREMWGRATRSIFSPAFQARATWGRIRSHFLGTSVVHRIAMIVFLLVQFAVITAMRWWIPFLVVWVVPITVCFNASSVLRLCSRHVFPRQGEELRGRAAIAGYTHGIFIGEAAPTRIMDERRWSSMARWCRWWLRMLFVHLPGRLMVLVGDGPCHDYHHRHPRSRTWANYIFARDEDIRESHPGWPPYTEVWGLRHAIESVFDSLGAASPDVYGVHDKSRAITPEMLSALEE